MSLKRAEEEKLRESNDLCNGNGWLFCPMGWHTWAGVGPHGSAFLARLEKQIAGDKQGWSRITCLQEFRASLAFPLVRFIARQLRASDDAMPMVEEEDVAGPPFRGGPVFGDAELRGWEEEDCEIVHVGPIRVRRPRC
jgi:hypothetical protein